MSELQDAAAKFHAEWCTDRLELCRRGPDTCEFYAELIAALTAAYARGRAEALALLKPYLVHGGGMLSGCEFWQWGELNGGHEKCTCGLTAALARLAAASGETGDSDGQG